MATFEVLKNQPFTIMESETLRDVIQYHNIDDDLFGRDEKTKMTVSMYRKYKQN